MRMRQPVLRQSDGKSGQWLSQLRSYTSFEDVRAALREHYSGLDFRKPKAIAIVGAAGEGQRLSEICNSSGIRVVAIADDHPAKVGADIGGHRVVPIADLENIGRDVPIVIASHRLL